MLKSEGTSVYTDPSKGKRTDRTDCILLISRDGLHFDRRYMEAFFRPGLDPRKWESHANMMALGILSTGEGEVSMYLTNNAGGRPPHLRRLVLRTDGFASLSASYAGGEFTTRPLVFAGNQLILNVSTFAAGSLQVEVQDTSGSPFPGFAASDCPEIIGDEIERVVSWKGGSDLGGITGKPVRLRFVMKDADLYSLRFR